MLNKNPDKRLTLQQIAEHPWVATKTRKENPQRLAPAHPTECNEDENSQRLAPAHPTDDDDGLGKPTLCQKGLDHATAPSEHCATGKTDSPRAYAKTQTGAPAGPDDVTTLLSWPLSKREPITQALTRKLSNIKQHMSWSNWGWEKRKSESPSTADTES